MEEKNPFINNFSRVKNDNEWVSLSEKTKCCIESNEEVSKEDIVDRYIEVLSQKVGMNKKLEFKFLRFLVHLAQKSEGRPNDKILIDLDTFSRYLKKTFKTDISKASHQRVLRKAIDLGLIHPSRKRAWFFLNFDILSVSDSFTVTIKVVTSSNNSKCDQTVDFLEEGGCMLIAK